MRRAVRTRHNLLDLRVHQPLLQPCFLLRVLQQAAAASTATINTPHVPTCEPSATVTGTAIASPVAAVKAAHVPA